MTILDHGFDVEGYWYVVEDGQREVFICPEGVSVHHADNSMMDTNITPKNLFKNCDSLSEEQICIILRTAIEGRTFKSEEAYRTIKRLFGDD